MRYAGGAGLSDADAAALADVVHDVVAAEVQAAAADARRRRALARAFDIATKQTAGHVVTSRDQDMAVRGIAAEIAAATRANDRSLQRQMGEASILVTSLPGTLEAYERGDITQAHIRLITDLAAPLPDDARTEFEFRALPRCEEESAGRLRDELAILAEHLHPRSLTERHAAAREARCVRSYTLGDGMSGLTVIAPTLHVDAIVDRLTRQGAAFIDARVAAKKRRAAGGLSDAEAIEADIVASDERTMAQLQVDILTDMLLTAQPGCDPTRTDDGPGTLGAIRATVQVVVPALTLLGADDGPADLVGRAPIDADTARALFATTGAAGRVWDRIITDPVTGAVLHTDTRLATPAQRRLLRARDRHCRWPGCRVPAIRCEADHTVDHCDGGPTCTDNLESLCQRHHSMKQFTAWRVRQLGDGVLEWTSPLGIVYIDTPPAPTVHFSPDDPVADRAWDAFGSPSDPGDPPPF